LGWPTRHASMQRPCSRAYLTVNYAQLPASRRRSPFNIPSPQICLLCLGVQVARARPFASLQALSSARRSSIGSSHILQCTRPFLCLIWLIQNHFRLRTSCSPSVTRHAAVYSASLQYPTRMGLPSPLIVSRKLLMSCRRGTHLCSLALD
jgi:hypothetical protein